MSASPSRLPTIRPPVEQASVSRFESPLIVVIAVVTFIALLNAIGLLVVLRRFAGALSEELPSSAMLLTAAITMATVMATRAAWRRAFPLETSYPPPLQGGARRGSDTSPTHPSGHSWDVVVGWGSSLALILMAVGCCYPANNTSDWLIWLPLLAADQFWRQTFFDAGEPANSIAPADIEFDEELAAVLAFPTEAFQKEHEALDHELEAALLKGSPAEEIASSDEQIVQQLYRVRDDQGQEIVYGTIRADFEAGQRTAVVHVGFCPPLSHTPEIEAESLPGSPSKIRIVQALAHGTRLDVRLPAAAESDRHIWIDMAATPVTEHSLSSA